MGVQTHSHLLRMCSRNVPTHCACAPVGSHLLCMCPRNISSGHRLHMCTWSISIHCVCTPAWRRGAFIVHMHQPMCFLPWLLPPHYTKMAAYHEALPEEELGHTTNDWKLWKLAVNLHGLLKSNIQLSCRINPKWALRTWSLPDPLSLIHRNLMSQIPYQVKGTESSFSDSKFSTSHNLVGKLPNTRSSNILLTLFSLQ